MRRDDELPQEVLAGGEPRASLGIPVHPATTTTAETLSSGSAAPPSGAAPTAAEVTAGTLPTAPPLPSARAVPAAAICPEETGAQRMGQWEQVGVPCLLRLWVVRVL